MTASVVEDFAAIRARMLAIRAAESGEAPAPEAAPATPGTVPPANPVDFYAWLMGGGLWTALPGQGAAG